MTGPTEELLLYVRGMWCTSCAWLIEYALAKIPGVVGIEASFASDMVKVKYQPQCLPPSRILERIKSLGYEPTEFRPGQEREDRETRDLVLRIGLGAFLWMNVMYLSMTLYVSFFESIADSIRRYIPFVIWARTFQGMAVFGDRIRHGAPELAATLKQKGLLVYVVSGDAPATTRWAATAIGADQHQSEVSPEGKAEFVRNLQAENKVVAAIGDGINDAPALAQADLGIAMGSGTEVAMRAAPIVLMDASLSKIPEVFALSAKTIRIIKQNLFWAFGYNVLGIALAIAGILNPILAAAAMLLSSVSVIANSLRLSRTAD